MTREVHESLTTFATSGELSRVAETEIPDAKERIRYVIDSTDEAAHKTLSIVEQLMPVAATLKADAESLHSS